MPRRIEKRERGVYEKEPSSDVWWIRYKVDGTLHREKVGRRGDAIKLYKVRKTDALRGVKLPVNLKQRGIRFRVIGDEAVAWYENHGQKDLRTFKLRIPVPRPHREGEGGDPRQASEEHPRHCLEGTDQAVYSIRSMVARGKKSTVVVAAIARELAGFIWAIGQEMRIQIAT